MVLFVTNGDGFYLFAVEEHMRRKFVAQETYHKSFFFLPLLYLGYLPPQVNYETVRLVSGLLLSISKLLKKAKLIKGNNVVSLSDSRQEQHMLNSDEQGLTCN